MAKTPEEMCGKVITPRRVCGLTLNHNGGCEPTPPAPIAATKKCGKVVTPHRVCNREIHTGDCEPIAVRAEKVGRTGNCMHDKSFNVPCEECSTHFIRNSSPAEQVDAARLSAAEFLWGGYDWDKSGRGFICKHTEKLMLISDVMEAYAASLKQETQPPTCQMCKEIMVRNLMQSSVAGFHCRKCGASAAAELPPPRDPHKTIRVQVWADVDEGIADLVIYLNTIAGVYTDASCQGTIGEGGPHPYRAQVMAHWTKEVEPRLQAEFDITFEGECWGYIHPREGWKTPLAEKENGR